MLISKLKPKDSLSLEAFEDKAHTIFKQLLQTII